MTKEERNNKIEQLKAISETVALIKSGYAGIDRNGTIKDRRHNQGLIACRENAMLNTPKPKPVKGEFQEGSEGWLRSRNRELNTEQDVVDKNMELFHLLKKNVDKKKWKEPEDKKPKKDDDMDACMIFFT